MAKTKATARRAKPTQVTKVTKARRIAAPAKKLPTKAVKPARPTKPSLPLPPPPPPPPATRDEQLATRDIARLLRYGERFGAHRIDVRMLPLQLPVAADPTSAFLAVLDPGTPKSWRVFDRPISGGQFRVMLSVAIHEASRTERLAALVIHVGRPPIVKWTVAHYSGQKKPKTPDMLPRCASETGWIALVDSKAGSPGVIALPPPSGVAPVECPLADGRRALAMPCGKGEYSAYWAVDAADKPICLVLDFDVFTQKDWKSRST